MKVAFISIADYDGPVIVKSGLDDDAESYMYELFGDVTGDYEGSITGMIMVVRDDVTTEKVKELLS